MRSALQDQCCWSGIAGFGPGAGHSFAMVGGMERVGRSRAGSIKRAASPFGGHDKQRARAPAASGPWSPRLGQATDLAVTQPVVGTMPASSSRSRHHSGRRASPCDRHRRGRRRGAGRRAWTRPPACAGHPSRVATCSRSPRRHPPLHLLACEMGVVTAAREGPDVDHPPDVGLVEQRSERLDRQRAVPKGAHRRHRVQRRQRALTWP